MDLLRDRHRSLALEWLETNGIGGYASSTISTAHTRRHHGLLVAALQPPGGRRNLLTALDVAVQTDKEERFLTTHLYPDTTFPAGDQTLERLDLRPFPQWTHRVGKLVIAHELWMDPGRNTTVLTWSLVTGKATLRLRVIPLLGLRDVDALRRPEPGTLGLVDSDAAGCLTIRPHEQDAAALHLHHSEGTHEVHDRWYRSFQLPAEMARGEAGEEDLWSPGAMTLTLAPDAPAILIATTEDVAAENSMNDPRAFAVASRERRVAAEAALAVSCPAEPAVEHLAPAVRTFRAARADGRPTVVAGYHWFGDWGRDTMVALPGLCLVHGHMGEAMATLRHWMRFLDGGMLPNCFPDMGDEPRHDSVDAALWLPVAVLRTWMCLGNRGAAGLVPGEDLWVSPRPPAMSALSTAETTFLHEALDALEQIIAAHLKGTHHGVRVDEEDGLITQGDNGIPLTWMNARIGDVAVTPRPGKPIEIQALWNCALRTTALLRRLHGDSKRAATHEALAAKVCKSVATKYLDREHAGLADRLSPEGKPDWSVRPNQILAVSLPFPLVRHEVAMDVVATVEQQLVTPCGLRTLAPDDPAYRGSCVGPLAERERAAHQGSIWPWLIGPWIDAALRVRGPTPAVAKRLRDGIQPLVAHVDAQACLGSVSELFEGDPPHAARGCIAQAWSVAELLRALWILSEIRWRV